VGPFDGAEILHRSKVMSAKSVKVLRNNAKMSIAIAELEKGRYALFTHAMQVALNVVGADVKVEHLTEKDGYFSFRVSKK